MKSKGKVEKGKGEVRKSKVTGRMYKKYLPRTTKGVRGGEDGSTMTKIKIKALIKTTIKI